MLALWQPVAVWNFCCCTCAGYMSVSCLLASTNHLNYWESADIIMVYPYHQKGEATCRCHAVASSCRQLQGRYKAVTRQLSPNPGGRVLQTLLRLGTRTFSLACNRLQMPQLCWISSARDFNAATLSISLREPLLTSTTCAPKHDPARMIH